MRHKKSHVLNKFFLASFLGSLRIMDMETTKRPKVGMVVTVHGVRATIRKVHAVGTVDVETDKGGWFRLTGLMFK
jgi:translation initiation factor 6 (eIF-6)